MASSLAISPHAPSIVVSHVGVRSRLLPSGPAIGKLRLLTDPVGTTTLTLTNVVVGSRYRIERQGDGSLATPTANAEGVAASATVPITLDYYAAGNANNDVRIKVRKGTAAPKYLPFETQATLGAAAQSTYVAQVADPIA